MKFFSLLFLIGLFAGPKARAQIDPTLTGMIYAYTQKAESELKAQQRAMMLESTGHIWIREEMEATYDIQKKFNDYLDTSIEEVEQLVQTLPGDERVTWDELNHIFLDILGIK